MLENNLDVVSGVTVRRDFETNVESEWCRALYRSKKKLVHLKIDYPYLMMLYLQINYTDYRC